jgi:4-amino-4-deoxy-L-arabinose transferase-like glycosyltransferase
MASLDRALAVAAFLFAAVLLFARLGELPLVQPDEGRNAEIAREMKESGAWLVPTYDGIPYLDKPAFHFRAVALSLSLLGDSEFAARLPSVVFALALLAALFVFCRRVYGPRCAALAVVITATSPLFLAFGRIVILDMALALFVSISILAGFVAEEDSGARRRWSFVSAGAAALATLVKGPVGFLVPLLVLSALHISERRPRAILRLFSPLNVLLFAAIVLPWFLTLAHRHPDFPHYGIVEETLRRYATSSFRRTGPFYYYAPVLLAVFFPWSVLLPESIALAVRRRRTLLPADRLFIIWAIVVVLFFSTSQSKLPGYVLTAVVALGVLIARMADHALEAADGPAARALLRGAVALAILCAILSILLAVGILDPDWVRRSFRIRSREFDRLVPAFRPLAIALALIGSVALVGRVRRNVRLAMVSMSLFPVALLTICFGGLGQYAEAGSARSLARALPSLPVGTEIACVESFPGGLPFYLGRSVTLVSRDGREFESNYILYRLKRNPVWPRTLVRLTELDAWLTARGGPVMLIGGRRGRPALEERAARLDLSLTELGPGYWGVLLPRAEVP